MVDNLGYTPGTGATIRAVDKSGVHRQVLQIDVGELTEVLLKVGQQLMAGSLPVAVASDQSAVPVSAAALPLPSGAATAARQDTGNASLSTIAGTDFATQTTLASVLTALQTIDNFISGSKGLVTEDNSAAIKTNTDKLNVNLNLLHAGDSILIGTTTYTVKQAKIDRATSGELLALVSSKKLRVISGYFTVAADTTVTLKSHTTVSGVFTATGPMTMKAGGGMMFPRDPDGHIETTSGEALDVTLGTACQISGMLKYVEV